MNTAPRRTGLEKTYEAPANLVQLLDAAVQAAAATRFYGPFVPRGHRISSLDDFKRLPVTPISLFREQTLRDVVPDIKKLEWIAGAHKGQRRNEVAVVEGTSETATRYELLKDAMRDSASDLSPRTAAAITSPGRRFFAAEVCSILGYLGIPAHVFIDDGTGQALDRLHKLSPELLCILTDDVDESAIPSSVSLCITFRRSHSLTRFRQLDMYLVDEFGFLGHSTDLGSWILYNDQYLFEEADGNRLVVTALHNLTQPLIRLETHDTVDVLGDHRMRLDRVCDCD